MKAFLVRSRGHSYTFLQHKWLNAVVLSTFIDDVAIPSDKKGIHVHNRP